MKFSLSRFFFLIIFSFILFSQGVLCAQEITNEEISEETTEIQEEGQLIKREWFIYYKNSKKIIAGPFDDLRGALNAWINNSKIESKGKYYIGRNGVLFTNNPENYYRRQFDALLAELTAEPQKNLEEKKIEAEKQLNSTENSENSIDNEETAPVLTKKELCAQKKAERERKRQEKKLARQAQKEKKRQEKLAAKYGTTYEAEPTPEIDTESETNTENIENGMEISDSISSDTESQAGTLLEKTENTIKEVSKPFEPVKTENSIIKNDKPVENPLEKTPEPEPSDKKDEEPWIPESELFSGNNRYQKKYLSDYIKNDTFTIPESPDSKKSFQDFQNSLEYENFLNEINEVDSMGTTSLMAAVRESNDWKIKNLLLAGADVNAKDKDGWTAIMYAVRYQNNLSVLNLLLEAGADVKAQNNYSLSALVLAACYNNNPDIIKKLLSFYSPSDKEVQKAFVHLISTQTNDTVALVSKTTLFLDFGLPVNSYYDGKTPLMYACKYCKTTKVIKLLLDKKASQALRSTDGKTAFDYAQENKSLPKDEIYWNLNKR